MANKLDTMDLKQKFSFHFNGYSNRKIGFVLGISRNKVNTYMNYLLVAEYKFKELLGFDSAILSDLFPSYSTLANAWHNELMLNFEGENKARNQPVFTFHYHYQQYIELLAEPYIISSFSNIIAVNFQKKKIQ